MSRHGLQYLDLLKVDAEGAEWSSFHSLLEGCATSGEPVPVGQISVELHYQSLDKLENLFGLLQACGYLSVSREVNVNPCVNLGICHAAEYLFINPKRYYNADAIDVVAERQQAEVPPQPGAVIYILSHRKRLAQLCTALKLLYINFCVSYPRYPVIIFHDDFTDEDEIFVKNAVNSVRARRQPMMDLRIIRIKLDYPIKMSESRKTELKVLPKDHKCAATIGYRHMCHFHSFEAVEILRRQGFSHDYIMRLDDDSQITAPIGYDIFQMMHANGKKYGFAKIMSDDPLCVEGLWQEAEKFIEAAQTMRLPLLSKQQAAALRNTSTIESFYALMPSPFIFYNNFEIVHKSVWEHPLWLAWSDHIKASEGVYSKRWGDAPIHTIGVSMILAKKQIHRFKDLPYRHLPFIDQLPQGLPRPSADPFEIDTRCIFFDSWTCNTDTHLENEPQPLHELHGYFSPQHFGWLGGDVAASFELPRYAGDSAAERQFLWLFGDTLIGTSSSKQRLEFAMISNSVAIATMRTGDSSLDSAPGQKWNPISSLKYYWSSDDAGKPISIFPMHSGTHHHSAIWPSSGATVGSSVVIVGKLSQDVSSSRKTLLQEIESTLAFKHVGSILIVIQNPLAPPDQWKMTTSLLPYVEAGNGEYLWHTLALASAAESNSKMAYLQGIHSKFGGGRSAFDIFAVVRRKYDSAVIGRIPTAALVSHDISQLEILAEVASKTINWTFLKKEPALDPHRIAPANSESSLTWDSGTNQWVLVSLYPMEHILVCRSKGAKLEVEEAEWGCTKVKVPKHLIDNRDLMTYAAKVHPEMLEPLSDGAKKGPSRLVISICTNVVSGPWKLQQTEYFTAYTPQFFLL
eukprot:GSChrysophyteH1.ASY1.ANO1.2482.1 assembled CDS